MNIQGCEKMKVAIIGTGAYVIYTNQSGEVKLTDLL